MVYKAIQLSPNPQQLSPMMAKLTAEQEGQARAKRAKEIEEKRHVGEDSLLNNLVSAVSGYVMSGFNPIGAVAGGLSAGTNPVSSLAQGASMGGMVGNVLGGKVLETGANAATGGLSPNPAGLNAPTVPNQGQPVVAPSKNMPNLSPTAGQRTTQLDARNKANNNILDSLSGTVNQFSKLMTNPESAQKASILLSSLANPKNAMQGLSIMATMDSNKQIKQEEEKKKQLADVSTKKSAYQLWRVLRNEAGELTPLLKNVDTVIEESLNSNDISGESFNELVNTGSKLLLKNKDNLVSQIDLKVNDYVAKLNQANTIAQLDKIMTSFNDEKTKNKLNYSNSVLQNLNKTYADRRNTIEKNTKQPKANEPKIQKEAYGNAILDIKRKLKAIETVRNDPRNPERLQALWDKYANDKSISSLDRAKLYDMIFPSKKSSLHSSY